VKATADHLHRHLRGVPPEGKTAGVVFVADDLAAWLIGVLADAGRKKLTRLVLGSDQERAPGRRRCWRRCRGDSRAAGGVG